MTDSVSARQLGGCQRVPKEIWLLDRRTERLPAHPGMAVRHRSSLDYRLFLVSDKPISYRDQYSDDVQRNLSRILLPGSMGLPTYTSDWTHRLDWIHIHRLFLKQYRNALRRSVALRSTMGSLLFVSRLLRLRRHARQSPRIPHDIY